jgi:hypothetical protein
MAHSNRLTALIVLWFASGTLVGICLSDKPKITIKTPAVTVIVEPERVCPSLIPLPEDVASLGTGQSGINS